MLRANPRVLSTALFSALGLLPLACGGTFSGAEENEGGTSSGGSSSGGGKATAGKASGGSSTSGGKASGGGSNSDCKNPTEAGPGYVRCDDGTLHRPRIEECPSSVPRPIAKLIAPPGGEGTCTSDADCADMPHGYCTTGVQVPGMFCAYGCVKDSECGAGNICVCGDPVGRCVGATCTSDDDCGSSFRCQSYDSSNGCGIERFACQTPDDTCANDADCISSMAGELCSAASGTFTCVTGGCAIGRPFLVEGEVRVAGLCRRSDWCTDLALPLAPSSPELRARVSKAWAHVAQMEHASVAAFARFALQLLQLGAPPELVQLATAAMADETRHAQLAFGVASAYAGSQLGPAALAVHDSLGGASLVEVTRLVMREGCIGETAAALEAHEAAAHARSPELAALLRAVAADETRHAELAWRFVRWALGQQPGAVAAAVRSELERGPVAAAASASSNDEELLAHGVVPEALRRELQKAAFRDVTAPCAAALLAQAASQRAENPVLSA